MDLCFSVGRPILFYGGKKNYWAWFFRNLWEKRVTLMDFFGWAGQVFFKWEFYFILLGLVL